ncbi:MAG: sulfotransferase [Pseudomonadota bacterium]|nr:sulfotransferase [Pseudomonadota bacterium]
MTQAVFIIGNKRSGSTQLMHLMNLHPNIFVSNESDIIWILYRFHNDLEIVPYQWDTPIGMNDTLERYGHLLSKDKTPAENFITIQTAIMEQGCRKLEPMHKKNLLWIGDQKPFQQIDPEIIPFIKEHFPNARFLHLIRHPFPVVQSSKVFVGDLWKGMSDVEILKRWTMHEQWVNLEKQKNELPIIDVTYEGIIEDTPKEMKKIFEFLQVDYDEHVLREARRITRRLLKLHPRLPCPPETQAIMSQYGYPTHSFLLEKPAYINSVNFFRRSKRKFSGSW